MAHQTKSKLLSKEEEEINDQNILLINGGQNNANNKSNSYENPNYRKLYAKLSMDMMIGNNGNHNDADQPNVDDQTKNNVNDNQTYFNQFNYDDDDDDVEDGEDSLDEEVDDYEDLSSGDEQNQNLLKQKNDSENKSNNNNNNNGVALDLPEGWERHEDELGSYFWHIPTGTIQRERPFLDTIDKSMIRSDSLVFLDKSAINIDYNPTDSIQEEEDQTNLDAESKEDGQDHQDDDVPKTKALQINRKKIIANMQLTFTDDDDDDDDESEESSDFQEKELSFVVHSLGWLDVDESQINSKTGSTVIKRCIYELSTRADNAARCWGPNETQSLILKINGERIQLLEPNTSTTLSVQLIREIRMWAVDDNNNFAYVVKDRKSGKPGTVKCHVFHCDDPQQDNSSTAQQLAIYLKDALVRIKQNSSDQQQPRPQDLILKSSNLDKFEFPTPIEEPKKIIKALYIGFVPVLKPMGVDVLNMAIDEIVQTLKMSLTKENHNETELMRPVLVNISPSNIVVECQETGATIVECRVRYLSFLGISLDNVKRCGFIMQINEKEFVCHCFEVEPSAGSLCKTIEAACKLRYQKCLDAHCKQQQQQNTNLDATASSSLLINNQKSLKNDASSSTVNNRVNSSKLSSPVATAIKSSISGVFTKILNKTQGRS